ncbi:MAG: hypothetical protein Q4P84_08460, partial [Elusimicrobiales bacterium]|nr:hypothetical protein [Elusimicrobiales bacterium]
FAPKVNPYYKPKELEFVKQPELIGNVAKDAEPYVEKGEKSADNILNKQAPLIRDNGTRTANNYKYQVTTFIYANGEKQTEVPGDALYKEQNTRYLAQFMTDEEKTVYKYLLGKFGKDEAEKYINETLNSPRYMGNRLEDRAEIHDTQRRYKSMGKNAPIISRLATPVLGVGAVIQGIGLDIKKANGETPAAEDYSNFVGRQAMYEAQNTGHGALYTWLNDAANGLLENLGGMALTLVPVVGKALEASFSGIQAMGDYYANAALNGEWNESGTGATGIAYGITGALEWGFLGKGVGKAGGKSALKEAVVGISNKALSGMGIGGAQQFVNTTAETIIKRENSTFQKTYAQLRHEGWDKNEAYSQAVKNVFVAPTVNAAVVGGIMGSVMGLPDTVNDALSFSRRGKSLMSNGTGTRDVVEDGLTLNKNSAAYKNAEALKRKAEKNGWESISHSQLGAQDFLNEAELVNTYNYSKRYTDALGIRLNEADLPEGIEGMSEGGTVVLNRNSAGLDISDTVRHEVGHEALRSGTPERSAYMEGLQSAVDYDRAYARMEQRLKERGQRYDRKIVDEELAAEFAINISPGLRDLPRLERAVKGSPRLYDKVYNNLRTLQAKLKARGGKQFYDENTGVRIGYEELNHMRQSLEAMLVKLPESAYNEGSAMYRAKKQDDVNRYGVDIGAELDKMSGKGEMPGGDID